LCVCVCLFIAPLHKECVITVSHNCSGCRFLDSVDLSATRTLK
jgi:hypothetical protein